MGLLHRRSRSWRSLKMFLHVWLEDFFSVCLIVSALYLLNWSTFFFFFKPNLMWWCIIMKWCVMRKCWFTIFSVKVKVRDYVIYTPPSILFSNFVLWCLVVQELVSSKYDSVYSIFWTADPFATKLLMNKSVLWRSWAVVYEVKISKCQWMSGWQLLKCWTFYNPIWYGDASLWARLSVEQVRSLTCRSQ